MDADKALSTPDFCATHDAKELFIHANAGLALKCPRGGS
jgi:hypothetical protein